MVAVSDSGVLEMYKNCFSCKNLVKETCTRKGWDIENGFAGEVYASTCTSYKENMEKQPPIIEFC